MDSRLRTRVGAGFPLNQGMLVFVNGKVVPERDAVLSVFDRGFLYGDGLFETMRVFRGRPFRWEQHFERLTRGAEFLRLQIPFSGVDLFAAALDLIAKNAMPDALLRLTVSRGVGPRGYSPRGADRPTVVMSLHDAPPIGPEPPQWRLVTASVRLPANEPLALFKTCNKLPQIVARAEAEAAGADEALLANTDGHLVEGSTSNLFWVDGGVVCTPPLTGGILAGVTRATVLEICDLLGVATREIAIRAGELKQAAGVFLSLSSWGIAAAQSLDGVGLPQSPLATKLHTTYWDFVREETGR